MGMKKFKKYLKMAVVAWFITAIILVAGTANRRSCNNDDGVPVLPATAIQYSWVMHNLNGSADIPPINMADWNYVSISVEVRGGLKTLREVEIVLADKPFPTGPGAHYGFVSLPVGACRYIDPPVSRCKADRIPLAEIPRDFRYAKVWVMLVGDYPEGESTADIVVTLNK
jgi:hypothetical protein